MNNILVRCHWVARCLEMRFHCPGARPTIKGCIQKGPVELVKE